MFNANGMAAAIIFNGNADYTQANYTNFANAHNALMVNLTTKNINNYQGGGIGLDGNAYQLGGRNVSIKAKPEYNIQVEGKVVVIITVDRMGNVINAITGAKGSTTLNKKLLEQAKLAALKTKFESKPTAPLQQQGKIIYSFRLN